MTARDPFDLASSAARPIPSPPQVGDDEIGVPLDEASAQKKPRAQLPRRERFRQWSAAFWYQMSMHRRLSPFGDVSYRTQLAVLFGAVVTIVVVALSIVFVALLTRTIRADASRSLQGVADNVSRALSQGMQDRYQMVQMLGASASLWEKGLASPEVAATIARQQSLHSHLAWIGVANLDGQVKAATGGVLLGNNVSARPWFKGARNGIFVGDLHEAALLSGRTNGGNAANGAKGQNVPRTGEVQRFVDFAAPVIVHDQVVGVIGAHGNWDWARSVVDSILPRYWHDALTQYMQVFVFNKNGDLILSPETGRGRDAFVLQRQPKIEQSSAAQEAISAIDGTDSVVRWADGGRYLTVASDVGEADQPWRLGWTVVVRLPASVAFVEVAAARKEAGIAGAGAVAVAALIAWLVAGRVSAPLSRIALAAEAVHQGKKGARIPVLHTSREIASLTESLAAMTTQLIDDRRNLERRVAARTAELDRMARYDALTEVYNRRGFDDHMTLFVAQARRRKAPLALVMVDADHFKRVNDQHGHDVGDEVLRTLARVMKQRLRSTDIISRVGGEEFVLLLPDTGLKQAMVVADELVKVVGQTKIPIVGHVTVSCGVVELEEGEDGSAGFLKRADVALYRAKNAGRNQAAFEDTDVSPLT